MSYELFRGQYSLSTLSSPGVNIYICAQRFNHMKMAHLAQRMIFAQSFLQVTFLFTLFFGVVLTENPDNITELCLPQFLPCGGDECVMSSREGNPTGGPAVCTCPSTGYQTVKYCYTQRPTWSDNHENYLECKWGSGNPRHNTTFSDTIVTPPRCDMGVYAFCPETGPVSGGTDVMIWGHGFANRASDMDVSFTGFECTIISSNSTFIHCLTSSVAGTNARGSYLRLRIELPKSGCKLEEKSAFTYKYDPTITEMHPLQSFLGGGTIITVTGTDLNSTASVIMQFTTIYKQKRQLTATECTKKNTTMVLCPAPRIYLDINDIEGASNSTSGSRRRRRQVGLLPGSAHFRWKRDSTQGLLESPDLTVYGGLKLDGLLTGQVFSPWKVYKNPIVEEFPGEFLNYRPSWPDYDKAINIYGENLLSGVTDSDYSVTVGSVPCPELLFSHSSIICTPPKDPPIPPPGALQRDGDPALVVKVGNLEYVVGYVHYDMDQWNNSKVRYAVIGVLAAGIPVIICIIILIVVRCHYRRKRLKKEREQYDDDDDMFPTKSQTNFTMSPKNDYIVGEYLHPKANLIQALSPELRTQVQACLIHVGRVDKTHIKSRGEHGAIYRGWLLDEKGSRMVSADIKTFKHDNVPFRDLKSFMEDAVRLRGFDHDHVQRLLAVTVDKNMPQAVVPSSHYGDLKSFLYKQRQRQEGEEELTIDQMVKLGTDIASGMTFLSEKGFVHEDLAARNCVLDKDLVVKVGDATLSRDIYELDYWRPGEKLELRPVKWMAPESLDNSFFSVKSDVWSFGVTLWEIFTLGMTPYTDVANADIREQLKLGHRLSKPDSMPVSLYTEVTHCWAKEPNKRPHFQALFTALEQFGGPSTGGRLNEGYYNSQNNIISEVGAHVSTTPAERISAYIEEETRQRNSAESERDSKISQEASVDADENDVELTEVRRDSDVSQAEGNEDESTGVRRDSDVSQNVSLSGGSVSSKEPDGINPRNSTEKDDVLF